MAPRSNYRTRMTAAEKAKWQDEWMTRRLRQAVDGLSLASSAFDELLFEANRPGTTIPPATRDALAGMKMMIAGMDASTRKISPITIPLEV